MTVHANLASYLATKSDSSCEVPWDMDSLLWNPGRSRGGDRLPNLWYRAQN